MGFLDTDHAVQALRSVILNVGSALIGASAIVSSLVLFAMQVNIERMPFALFRSLSADFRLVGAFAAAFVLALGVAGMSTLVERSNLGPVVLAVTWAVFWILYLFRFAYMRALDLISPVRQMAALLQDVRRDLRMWGRLAGRLAPLFEQAKSSKSESLSTDSTHDLPRTRYFQNNSRWADRAKQGIQDAMSFARLYAERGDYEISRTATDVVVAINAAYIDAKGKTFFASRAFVEDYLSHDGLVGETLELARQNVQMGIRRRDERQLEQTLGMMAELIRLYLSIDYSSPWAAKSDAYIAAGYLGSAVEAVLPHHMTDVLLQGQRLMGRSAQLFIASGSASDIATLGEKIAAVSYSGCARNDYWPVTMEGMTQFANLTVDLLCLKTPDRHYLFEKLRGHVTSVSKLFLKVIDTSPASIHARCLGPYYSPASSESLRTRMAMLAHALCAKERDHKHARTIIQNIGQWADGLFIDARELLLAAILERSSFTFDMIKWVTDVTEILLVVAGAPACDVHSRKDLQKHAQWLIATLDWVPHDEEAVKFVASFQLADTLLESAAKARELGFDEVAQEIGRYLLSWTFKGGRYETGWGVLERGLCGVAAFAVVSGAAQVDALKRDIESHLQGDRAPAPEILRDSARRIRRRATRLHEEGHWSSAIDSAVAQCDHGLLAPLLKEIAENLLAGANGPSA